MTNEELKQKMIDDPLESIEGPTGIDKDRSKRHKALGDPGAGIAKLLDKGAAGIQGAIAFLKKMGLKNEDVLEATKAIAEQTGIELKPEQVEWLRRSIWERVDKNYSSAMEKAMKRLDEPGERYDPYKKKDDYVEMEEEEIEMLMAEIKYSNKKKGVKMSKKNLREAAIKAMKERWEE